MSETTSKNRVIFEAKANGVENFGSVYESWKKPVKIEVDETGKVWKVADGKKELLKYSGKWVDGTVNMTEEQALLEYC